MDRDKLFLEIPSPGAENKTREAPVTLLPELPSFGDEDKTREAEDSTGENLFFDLDDIEFREVVKSAKEEDFLENHLPFLARGTQLYCTCGTHKRRLNLPIDHGVYIQGKPLIHAEDCVEEDNISSFGICQSEENPVNKNWFKKKWDEFLGNGESSGDEKKIILKTENGDNVKGYACKPCIVSMWMDSWARQMVARNDTDGSEEGDRIALVTSESFLVCAYGGIIQPVTSGQED